MRKVYLEGILGEKFGEEWNLAVNSPAEAMQAIAAQRSGFKQFLIEGENKDCLFSCPTGYFREGNECEKCSEDCKTCVN